MKKSLIPIRVFLLREFLKIDLKHLILSNCKGFPNFLLFLYDCYSNVNTRAYENFLIHLWLKDH